MYKCGFIFWIIINKLNLRKKWQSLFLYKSKIFVFIETNSKSKMIESK